MRTITVYDPAMCCSSGVCGADVDPLLPQFADDLDWLKRQGIAVERLNLAREPERFLQNPAIKALLEQGGDSELPAIVVDSEVASRGRHPSRDELAAMAGLVVASADLSETTRELIAIGAAIGASCEPCLKFHYDKARKLGVSTAAMQEAVRVGEMVKNASTKNMLKLAEKLIGRGDDAPAIPAAPAAAAGKSACCS